MKPAHEWDWDYIQTLPIGEFDWLEAKGIGGPPGQAPKIEDSKVREMLAKVISALANTGGGQFIWGVKDPDDAKGWFVENGGVPARYGKRATGDWLEDIIPNLMDAPLRSFNVYTVREAEGLAEDHVLFVIDVKDSSLAPHQNTWDNKYYGRVGGKSKPLNHRFVMDIIGRRQNPELTLDYQTSVEINQLRHIPGQGELNIYLDVGIRNTGRVTAHFPALEVLLPPPNFPFAFHDKGKGANPQTIYGLPKKLQSRNDTTVFYAGTANDIIFPGQSIEIARHELTIGREAASKQEKISFSFRIYADGFQTEGKVDIELLPILRRGNFQVVP